MAIRWLLEHDNVLPTPGAKNANQAQANVRALIFTMTADEVQEPQRATRAWRDQDNWPTTVILGAGADRCLANGVTFL